MIVLLVFQHPILISAITSDSIEINYSKVPRTIEKGDNLLFNLTIKNYTLNGMFFFLLLVTFILFLTLFFSVSFRPNIEPENPIRA